MMLTGLFLMALSAAEPAPPLETVLMDMERAGMARWAKGDPSGFQAILSPTVTYFDPQQERRVDGLPAINAIYDAVRGKFHLDDFEFIDPKVQQAGDCAVLTFHVVTHADGQETRWDTTDVFQREGGEWRIVHSHYSLTGVRGRGDVVIPPSPPLPDDAVGRGVAAEVFALQKKAMERWAAGDPGVFLELLEPDVTLLHPPLEKRADGLAVVGPLYEKERGKMSERAEFIDPKVQLAGDAAVLTFRLVTRMQGEDRLWNATEVYRRGKDGKWRILHSHYAPGKLPEAPPKP
jgi:ketosteroid isomerase-like protein